MPNPRKQKVTWYSQPSGTPTTVCSVCSMSTDCSVQALLGIIVVALDDFPSLLMKDVNVIIYASGFLGIEFIPNSVIPNDYVACVNFEEKK